VFTYYIPVLIPILGVETGVIYVSARAGIALAITVTGVLAGAFVLLSERNVDRSALAEVDATGPDADERTSRERVREAATKSWSTLRRTVPRLAVVYTLVIAFVTHYDVEALTSVAEPITGLLGLPGAAVPVIAVYTLDTTAGAVTLAGTAEGIFTLRTRGREPAHRRYPLVRRLHVPSLDPLPVRDLGRRIRHEGDRRQHRPEAPVHLDHSRAVARAGVVRLRGFINTTCGGVCLRAAALDGREQPARGRRRVAPAARESPILAGRWSGAKRRITDEVGEV